MRKVHKVPILFADSKELATYLRLSDRQIRRRLTDGDDRIFHYVDYVSEYKVDVLDMWSNRTKIGLEL